MDLQTYMRAHGLTDYRFGKLIGKSDVTVRRWRTGERRPRMENALEIQRITNGVVTPASFWAVPDQDDAA